MLPVKVSHLVLATILVPLELHHDLWQDIIEDFRVILQIKCDSMNNQPAARMIHPLGIRTRACLQDVGFVVIRTSSTRALSKETTCVVAPSAVPFCAPITYQEGRSESEFGQRGRNVHSPSCAYARARPRGA